MFLKVSAKYCLTICENYTCPGIICGPLLLAWTLVSGELDKALNFESLHLLGFQVITYILKNSQWNIYWSVMYLHLITVFGALSGDCSKIASCLLLLVAEIGELQDMRCLLSLSNACFSQVWHGWDDL